MFTIKKVDDRGVLFGKQSAALIATLPSLEGKRGWLKSGGLLWFEPSVRNIKILTGALGAKVVEDNPAPATPKPKRVTKVERKTQPMPHQKAALEHFDGKDVMALFMEQGTGKTKTFIDWTDDLWSEGKVTGAIVITRKGVHRQWAESELPKHMASPFEAHWWRKKITDHKRTPDTLQVITINWDGIKTEAGWQWVEDFAKLHKGKLVIAADEAQDMKNHTSQRHKAMMKIKPYSSHRAVLTGTPIAKDLTDEWAILKWLDEDILGVRYVTAFRAEYCVMGGFQSKSVIGHKEIGRFRELTAPYVFRVRKVDIGLMPKQYDEWTFDMLPTQKAMIRKIKQDLILAIEGKDDIRLDQASTALIKIQQISNGFAFDDDGKLHRLMEVGKNPRAVAAKEWADGTDAKAIIWCRFREDIAIMQEALGSGYVTYMGGMKDDERQASIDSFLSTDGAKILLATDAASTGLNLQGLCNRALYYSEGFNAVNRWQKEDRIDRIGTVGFTTHTDLIGVGSIDRHIHANRNKKKGISDLAIEGLRDEVDFTPEKVSPDAIEILYSYVRSEE